MIRSLSPPRPDLSAGVRVLPVTGRSGPSGSRRTGGLRRLRHGTAIMTTDRAQSTSEAFKAFVARYHDAEEAAAHQVGHGFEGLNVSDQRLSMHGTVLLLRPFEHVACLLESRCMEHTIKRAGSRHSDARTA